MGFWGRLFTGCSVHDDYRERDPEGRLQLVCRTCGDRRSVLTTAIIRGPQHDPVPVKGQPKLTAVTSKGKITALRSRRSG